MISSEAAAGDSVLAAEAASQARRWELPLLGFGSDTSAFASPAAAPPTLDEVEAIEAAAHAEGYQRGLAEGLAEARKLGAQQIRDEVQRLRALVEHLSRPLAQLDAEVERTLVALTIEVARRLVDEQLVLNPELTAAAVRTAVASISPPPREVRVHLHPEDATLLADLPAPAEVALWKIVADRELRRGDVRLVTDTGGVDALLDTRQSGVARALLGEHE